ncbi:MAG: porin family protein, partial [Beijerinckiaceae bacterium]
QDQNPITAGNINENWSWAAGARLGWLVTPRILTYTEAGFTEARFGGTQMNYPDGAPSGISTGGFTSNGWFMGAGVEAMVAPGWFVRGEYRYSEFGSHTITELTPAGPYGDSIHFRPETQTATIGLVYKFNWAPATPSVVAKY